MSLGESGEHRDRLTISDGEVAAHLRLMKRTTSSRFHIVPAPSSTGWTNSMVDPVSPVSDLELSYNSRDSKSQDRSGRAASIESAFDESCPCWKVCLFSAVSIR